MLFRPLVLLGWLLASPALLSLPAAAQAPASRPAQPGKPVLPAAPAKPATVKPMAPPVAPAGPPLVDINSADEKTLDTLPGVGAARAKAIVANRPYGDKNELISKKALPANVFDAIKDRLALANINTTTAAEMARVLPNVGPVRAEAIVKNRPYSSLPELVTKGAVSNGVYESIKSLITTGT